MKRFKPTKKNPKFQKKSENPKKIRNFQKNFQIFPFSKIKMAAVSGEPDALRMRNPLNGVQWINVLHCFSWGTRDTVQQVGQRPLVFDWASTRSWSKKPQAHHRNLIPHSAFRIRIRIYFAKLNGETKISRIEMHSSGHLEFR
jgi:hypothetical protein